MARTSAPSFEPILNDTMNLIPVKITARKQEAQDIVSFELTSVDGAPLAPFPAGAHVDVEVRPGLVRQYSLCNDPGETHRYLIAVLRDPNSRGGSIGMHDGLAAGQVIGISEPKNHFPLVPASRYLLFAGGIGITPILCMAERLARIGADFSMHYCSRSPERTAFLERIQTSGFADRVVFHFDAGGPEQKLDLPAVLDASPGAHVYVCGPGGFIDFVRETAKARGWPADAVHQEYFGAAPQDSTGDAAFEVKIASTGRVCQVPPGVSVVQALAAEGVEITVSCELGVCGTCITRVLEGTPDHRDVYFTDEERAANDQFTPCCSRARSRVLVLDL
jgi:vanillate O-demethylase ferredoxin subunit